MPDSRFVQSSRLRPLIIYLGVALVGLLVVDWLVGVFSNAPAARTLIAVAWLILLPYGGWLVWKRG